MKKKLIIIGIVVAVAVALYFVYKKVKADKEAEDTTGGGSAAPQQAQTPTYNNNANPTKTGGDPFPMKLGSSGDLVKILQQYLNKKYKSGLTLDGSFGAKTAAALKTGTGKSEIQDRDQFNTLIVTGKF
jgi:peptidoglycan hydrolase-like protein with peptidoglycan-binding domain